MGMLEITRPGARKRGGRHIKSVVCVLQEEHLGSLFGLTPVKQQPPCVGACCTSFTPFFFLPPPFLVPVWQVLREAWLPGYLPVQPRHRAACERHDQARQVQRDRRVAPSAGTGKDLEQQATRC